MVADGLADPGAYAAGRIVLTSRGRLLADTVTRMLTELCELGDPSYAGLATCAQIQAGTSYRSPRFAAPMPRIMYFSTVSQSTKGERDGHHQGHGEAVQQAAGRPGSGSTARTAAR